VRKRETVLRVLAFGGQSQIIRRVEPINSYTPLTGQALVPTGLPNTRILKRKPLFFNDQTKRERETACEQILRVRAAFSRKDGVV
jgi:hypothetical protein